MGDSRFAPFYARVERAEDPAIEIRALTDDGVVSALAWAAKKRDAVFANVLATEALNRMRRATTVTSNLGEGVLGLDLAGRIAFVNPAAATMLGWSTKELTGRTLHELVHPNESPGMQPSSELCEILTTQNATAEVTRGEDVFETRSGPGIPIAFTITPVVRENVSDGVVIILRDLTSEKAIQATLARQRTILESAVKSSIRGALETKKTKDRFRAIVEASPDAMIITNEAGKINHVNARSQELFGHARDALLGTFVEELIPGSRDAIAGHAVDGDDAPAASDKRFLIGTHKNGNELLVEVRARSLATSSGDIVVYVIRDASAQRGAEDRSQKRRDQLARFHDMIRDMISIVDLDRRIEFANSAFADLAHASPESLKGRLFEPGAMMKARNADAADARVTRMLDELERGGSHAGMCDLLIEGDDGSTRHLALKARPLVTEDGRTDGFAIAFSDAIEEAALTETARSRHADLERRVADRTRELALANHELEAFSYSVSHDLRAPLRAIEYLGNALREDCAADLDADGNAYVARIEEETRRLTQLITDLLDLSRVTRGEVQRLDVDLAKMARDVIDELRASAPDRDVEYVAPDSLSATGDPRLLRIVLDNVLGNAWKFTATTPGARIEFAAVGGGHAPKAFVVRDNGVGFSPTVADTIFAPFERASAADRFDGTGIGLATVQRIIERHGGRVWAEGSLNGGASIYFSL